MPQAYVAISLKLVAAIHARLKMSRNPSICNVQEGQGVIGRRQTCRLFCLWSPQVLPSRAERGSLATWQIGGADRGASANHQRTCNERRWHACWVARILSAWLDLRSDILVGAGTGLVTLWQVLVCPYILERAASCNLQFALQILVTVPSGLLRQSDSRWRPQSPPSTIGSLRSRQSLSSSPHSVTVPMMSPTLMPVCRVPPEVFDIVADKIQLPSLLRP